MCACIHKGVHSLWICSVFLQVPMYVVISQMLEKTEVSSINILNPLVPNVATWQHYLRLQMLPNGNILHKRTRRASVESHSFVVELQLVMNNLSLVTF